MSNSTGLRRFVSGPPSAARAGAVQRTRDRQSEHTDPTRGDIARGDSAPLPADARVPAPEQCELCATEIPAEHGHLADVEHSSLMCACRACYLLFTRRDAARGRYRAVPDRYVIDPAHPFTTADWDELEIPVGLAFFLRSSLQQTVTGFYPSPAGATECKLDLDSWERLANGHPMLGSAEPDVEAILIAKNDNGVESFIVPIDACYELAGRMRLLWRGFDGGTEARQAIAAFLGSVRSRVRALDQEG